MEGAPSEAEVKAAFDAFDKDGKGTICKKELRAVCDELKVQITEGEIAALIAEADADGDGEISYEEFKKTLC